MIVLCSPSGDLKAIYDDALNLSEIGAYTVRRASDVEPDAEGQWWADLTKSDGPKLGPFPRRGDAIRAEIEWLESTVLGVTCK